MNEETTSYFDWLVHLVYEPREEPEISFDKLLHRLHETEFIFSIEMDSNRSSDGIGLRRRYAESLTEEEPEIEKIVGSLSGPCSVLEMMLALAARCDESIMDDPQIGSRTKQWFWSMIASLGLNGETDIRYDENRVDEILSRFLHRQYEPNGSGGLFTIKDCEEDLREIEIWYQMCRYLDKFMGFSEDD